MRELNDDRLRIDYVPLRELRPHPLNPKTHDVDALDASIDRFGFADAPIVDERTGYLIAGHGRRASLIARKDAGGDPPAWVHVDGDDWLVPVQRGWASPDDEAAAAAFRIAHNRIGELGGWDDVMLPALLQRLADDDPALLLAAGFHDGDLDAMAADLTAKTAASTGAEGDDGWVTVTVRVPPDVKAAFDAALARFTGLDSERVAAVSAAASAWADRNPQVDPR